MFGKNEIVGQKYFNEAGDKLLVTSRFLTLQGEGPYSGKLAFFLRLAKCNLACSFCDTYFDSGNWMTIPEINTDIGRVYLNEYDVGLAARMKQSVFVLTGGEPMLQKNIVPLLKEMNMHFGATQIESNGTVYQAIPDETTLVCSPKCSEKNGVAVKYLTPRQQILDRANCLKFVMSSEEGSPYNTVPDWALDWQQSTGNEIYVSPMNIYNDEPRKSKELRVENKEIDINTRSTVDEVISFWEPDLLDMQQNRINHEYAAKYCMKHGLRFQLQTHLFASLA
jgi:7-carboxy-7-deazaguanine synthase